MLYLVAAVGVTGAGRSPHTVATGTQRLGEAGEVADRQGEGGADFTGFGPTNVQLHQVDVLLRLDDAWSAVEAAQRIDAAALAFLGGERQARHQRFGWASGNLADPAAAFWSIGLVFAFERRLEDNLARQRYLAIRKGTFKFIASRLCASHQGVTNEVAAELVHDMAVMGRSLTDGFRVAAAAGDDTDFARYAKPAADALESLISARLQEHAERA